MHQFVQSAIEAANQGDNAKAMSFLKQVLAANPRDVDGWLVLAAVVDDPERKRQCLQRVLTIDPVNQIAREELLEMDRAAMKYTPPFEPEPDPVSRIESPPAPIDSSTVRSQPPVISQAKSPVKAPVNAPANKPTEKTLVFKYPLIYRIVLYIPVVVLGCVGLMAATQSILTSLILLGLAVLSWIGLLTLLPKVEVSGQGIRASGTFSSAETGWDEIIEMKLNSMKRRLELTKRDGGMVNVSTRVSRYPAIVDILQKQRPDLFGAAPRSQTQAGMSSSAYGNASPATPEPAFKGARTFKKSFFKQYRSYLIVIPIMLFAVYFAFEPQNRIGAVITVIVCLILLVLPLLQVTSVKVEPNKLTIETLFEEKSFRAKEIRDIKVDAVVGRRGYVSHFINVIPFKGKNYPIGGFIEPDDVIFGALTNWWNAYRNG